MPPIPSSTNCEADSIAAERDGIQAPHAAPTATEPAAAHKTYTAGTLSSAAFATLLRSNQARATEEDLACIDAIKAIHAQPATLELGQADAWQKRVAGIGITRGGSMPKRSYSGALIGWYGKGQTRGKPNWHHPVTQAVLAAIVELNAMQQNVLPPAVRATARAVRLGRLSGARRRERACNVLILAYLQELAARGEPQVRHAKLAAKEFDCSVEYVRRVRRAAEKCASLPAKARKNTT